MTCFSKPASQQHPGLAQRLRDFVDAWRRIGASSHVESWIRDGVPVEFTSGPPPAFQHKSAPLDAKEAAWWAQEKCRLAGTGAIEPAYFSRFQSFPGAQEDWWLQACHQLEAHQYFLCEA